jgi:hypothetical protein
VKHAQRRTFVFVSLVAFMSATTAILLALSPQPLSPDLPQALLAIDGPAGTGARDPLEAIFDAAANARQGSWRYVHIRHSKTPGGDTASRMAAGEPVGDHFVICNGTGGGDDGEIQITPRWVSQRSALPPVGAAAIDAQCISICLVGDFDRRPPSDRQLRRLARLVCALQARLNIPANSVVVQPQGGTPAAAGRLFPVAEFRSQILP